jgi:hypothetical protein
MLTSRQKPWRLSGDIIRLYYGALPFALCQYFMSQL